MDRSSRTSSIASARLTSLVKRLPSLKRILVVGAGVAGLQATKAFSLAGFKVVTLEAEDDVGGVWTGNYQGYGLQVPAEFYQFPDFAYPEGMQPVPEYPSGEQIKDYVQAYARHFNLYGHIKLGCKLIKLVHRAKGGYIAIYFSRNDGAYYRIEVDYAIICTGVYNAPYVPEYENAAVFQGSVVHAKHFTDARVADQRHVVVVGAGKTALDCVCSVASAKVATSVTLLYRQAHWPLPRNFTRKLGVRHLLFNRAVSALLEPYYTESRTKQLLHKAVKPLKRLFWCSAQKLISRHFPRIKIDRPPVSLPKDLFYGGQILDNNFDNMLEEGDVKCINGHIKAFRDMGVVLNDDTFVRADLIVYCTGYTRSYEFLDKEYEKQLDVQKDGIHLYRNILPLQIPNLAFIGSEVSTFNNILTDGLQCQWLLRLLTGHLKLPPVDVMAKDVAKQRSWRRRVMPSQRCRGAVIMAYQQAYHDQLVTDMGYDPRRKQGWNPFQECFSPYSATDYLDIFDSPDIFAVYLSNRTSDPTSERDSRMRNQGSRSSVSDRLSSEVSSGLSLGISVASILRHQSEPDATAPAKAEDLVATIQEQEADPAAAEKCRPKTPTLVNAGQRSASSM